MKIINKKRLKKLFINKNTTAYKLVLTEIAIMKKINHPNVVRLIEIIDDPNYDKLYIIMEYINGGTLLKQIKINNILSEEKAWKYFRELILGLEYCHDVAGIIHRDIKPENILIDTKDSLHIVDFGVSFMIDNNGSDESKATLGSGYYMAPEIYKSQSYKGRQTDIWAAGVTLYYMVHGYLPFEGSNSQVLGRNITNNKITFREGINKDLKELLNKILEKDPNKRFSLNEIKNSKWVSKDNSVKLKNECFTSIIMASDEDRKKAISNFSEAFVIAKIKMLIMRKMKYFKERIKRKLKK